MSVMAVVSVHWRGIWTFCTAIFALLLYNEFLVYYVVLLQCHWPKLSLTPELMGAIGGQSPTPLRAMLLSDPHLLGPREGHWFDKLRREWQIQRTFQSAMLLFNPDVVFVLGDLFDEGKWSSESEFQYYVMRFRRMFAHDKHTKMHVVVGNHDIGFHYTIDRAKRERFRKAFDAPSVRLLRVKGISFVLLNSMAFEGDNCDMCRQAEKEMERVVRSLDCAEGKMRAGTCAAEEPFTYTKPIVIQHFPMFRESDSNCSGDDSVTGEEKDAIFRPKWDCLSKSASQKILQQLRPRLIFSGHTHNFCKTDHSEQVTEWTLASFSWRYRTNPTFLLAVIGESDHAINKCFQPNETTVINTYIVGSILIVGWFLLPRKVISYYRSANKKH